MIKMTAQKYSNFLEDEEMQEEVGLNEISRVSQFVSSYDGTGGELGSSQDDQDENYYTHVPVPVHASTSRLTNTLAYNNINVEAQSDEMFPPNADVLHEIEKLLKVVCKDRDIQNINTIKAIESKGKEVESNKFQKKQRRQHVQDLRKKERELKRVLAEKKKFFNETKAVLDKRLSEVQKRTQKFRNKLEKYKITTTDWKNISGNEVCSGEIINIFKTSNVFPFTDLSQTRYEGVLDCRAKQKLVLEQLGVSIVQTVEAAQNPDEEEKKYSWISFSNLDSRNPSFLCELHFYQFSAEELSFEVGSANPPFSRFEDLKNEANKSGNLIDLIIKSRNCWKAHFDEFNTNSINSRLSVDIFADDE